MLAEIYLLRLETLMRVSEEATLAKNFRFVPLNPADGKKHLEQRINCAGHEAIP
jgi:hypothetical protein